MNKSNFTVEQKKCIEFLSTSLSPQRHLLIEAGAGAGKTSVLIERVKWHLQSQKINPINLFLVTFSKDAAEQLRENAQKALMTLPHGEDFFSLLHISTIDSFFAELADCIYPAWWRKKQRQGSEEFAPILQLVDESSVQQELESSLYCDLKENLASSAELSRVIDFILSGGFKGGYNGNSGTLDYVLKTMCNEIFLSTNANEIRIVSQKIHPSTHFLIEKIHKIARMEYEKRILAGKMTYADRTVFLNENLNENTPISLKELIVDEYQDTNHIQHKILFNLVQKCDARMIVVGDPKQSIYGFRSASVDVFQNLKTDHNWAHIELKKNFRSAPALLKEINTLSQFTFSWENPELPVEFHKSFFYIEAKKKFIAENPLEAGKSDLTIQQTKCVHIVTSSLKTNSTEDPQEKELSEEKNKNKKITLKDILFSSIPHFINNFKETKKCHWHDIVILCERNKDIKEISAILKQNNIPVQFVLQENAQEASAPALRVALALAKYLACEEDLFDLYEILQSPISPFSHTEIEYFFAQKKAGQDSDEISSMLSSMQMYRIKAKDNFFRAWQLLRWYLVTLHQDEKSRKNASIFCTHMDIFARSLNKKLSSPYFRTQLEEKISLTLCEYDNDKIQKFDVRLLPSTLDKWDLQFFSGAGDTQEDAIEIKTVHGAKGLEWKYVCFVPKYGRKQNIGNFVMAKSERFIDITWLQDDTESLSLVKRIQNEKFNEPDSHTEYDKKGAVKKIHWFSNLRQHTEQEFERQRIFYTAFTRAKCELILFQPIRAANSKSGLLDELEKNKKNHLPLQKMMENDVYLRYIKYSKDFSENNVINLYEYNPESFISPLGSNLSSPGLSVGAMQILIDPPVNKLEPQNAQ